MTYGDGMYTAECEALHLVTEAESFERLTHRVWEIAPDMIEANGLDISAESLRLNFEFAQTLADHRVAL